MLECPYCSVKAEAIIGNFPNHVKYCIHNPNKKDYKNGKGSKYDNRQAWNKGLTKDVDSRMEQISTTLTEKYKTGELTKVNRPMSQEQKEKLSLAVAINGNHNGGYKRVPYISYVRKNGNLIKLRGTYEIRFATILDNLSVEWIYSKPIKYLASDGIHRHCLPDFYLPKYNLFFDTKGYFTNESKNKYDLIKEQHNIIVHVLFETNIKDVERDSNGWLNSLSCMS